MKYDDKYIIELLRASIFEDKPFLPQETVNWEYIYNKSIEQNITGLLYVAIQKLEEKFKPNIQLLNMWEKKMFATIMYSSKQYNDFMQMTKIISNSGIKMIALKGSIVRLLYPVPELRTMGDFDVLVKKTDLKNIIKQFETYGYEINKAVFGIEARNKNSFWEIFYVLEEEFINEPEKNTQEIYDNVFALGDVFVPQPTLFLSHMIVHTGKHYVEKGAGIRNLLDIALYIRKYKKEIDFKRVEQICKEQNYSKIYCYILNALTDWLGLDLSFIEFEKKDTDLFIEYTLLNGIFGKHGNVLLRQMSLDERENSHGVVRLLFPPVSTLKDRYKYLRKQPFLLPIAWIQRILFGIFVKKVKIRRMFDDIEEAVEFSDERLKWLNDLDLKKEH